MTNRSPYSALRCGIFTREHGWLKHTVGSDVKFNGTTREFEEKRRLEQRIANMSKEEKQKLLAKLLEA